MRKKKKKTLRRRRRKFKWVLKSEKRFGQAAAGIGGGGCYGGDGVVFGDVERTFDGERRLKLGFDGFNGMQNLVREMFVLIKITNEGGESRKTLLPFHLELLPSSFHRYRFTECVLELDLEGNLNF